MPKFPGIVRHNNEVEAILSLPENQVIGLGVFANVAARNTLNANMRSEGYIAVITEIDKAYMYTIASIQDTDWQNATNWIEVGSTYTLPTASTTVLGGIKVGTNLSIDVNGVLSATDTNTTYTAGNGLTLSGTAFNVGGTTDRITVSADSIDIASTYEGQTSITKLGTITTGVWNGTQIPIAYGGTNATTEAGARLNILPSYSGNGKKVLRVNSGTNDVEWSCISKDMFCNPTNTQPGTNAAVFNVFRDGQWSELEVGGVYSTSGVVTVANDAVVIKNINGRTPTNGVVKVTGDHVERSLTNTDRISDVLTDIEDDIIGIQDKLKYIVPETNDGKFEFSTTGGKLVVSETAGSLSKNNTGYFFSEASPGIAEIKVQDESATPVSRVAIKAVGVGSGARVGVHNTSPAYPLDITGNTRVTGNIIVTGTVDGVDVSELKNTVDNLTVGGTEEIELFSYFIS